LATRDTNILRVTGNVSGAWGTGFTKPFTLTALYNHANHANNYWSINNYRVTSYTDLRIEHIRMNSGVGLINNNSSRAYNAYGIIYGAYKNIKIGRGVTKYNNDNATINAIAGGLGTNGNADTGSNTIKYRMIVESGVYNGASATTLTSASGAIHINAYIIYGNDYDRVSTNGNEKLQVRYCATGSLAGDIDNGSSGWTVPAITTHVKSGQFGTNKYDYTTGIYLGGLTAGTHANLRVGIIEGGEIYNLIGGPLSKSTEEFYNDTIMYIKGGTIDVIVGGAGRTATYGNRIIQMTGGKVNYAIFGGSNGITGEDGGTQTAVLRGESYIYLGGTAVVGDATLVENNTSEAVSQVEAGSVFGAGNGNSNNSELGSVYNSTIIVDGGATIRRNVYGGGNYGAVGFVSSNPPQQTTIKILGGTVSGSVYGAANNNGSGGLGKVPVETVNNVSIFNVDTYESRGYTCTSNGGWYYTCVKYEEVDQECNINIEMTGGTVSGSVYGGSRSKGVVHGNTDVKIIGGTVSTDVYGGGEGGYTSNNSPGTFVSGNVAVTIGDTSSSSTPTISGSVYGGSAYGTVNASSTGQTDSTKSVTVTLNKGNVVNSIYGGAKGSDTYTPYVSGNITVTTNGGTATNVYGGCDQAGKPAGTSTVTLNGGTFTNVFGGGNESKSQHNTIVVIKSNASIGKNVYGGGNVADVGGDTNVNLLGGTITGNVYGGGQGSLGKKDADNREIYTEEPVAALVGSTEVNLNGSIVKGNIFGCNNLNGTPKGSVTVNIYKTMGYEGHMRTGANAETEEAREAALSNIDENQHTYELNTVYGGGNLAAYEPTLTTAHTQVNIYGCGETSIHQVYGGSNAASTPGTQVDVYGTYEIG
jgi:hypothetical protein